MADKARPRWAAELSDQTWERVNDLIDMGWSAADIRRETKLPAAKLRSLQIYVRKCGPRRRLMQFATFKDALLGGAVECSDTFAQTLGMIAALAVNPETPPLRQMRAFEAMTTFANVLRKLVEPDAEAEAKRAREGKGASKADPAEVVRDVLAIYGIKQDE